MEIGKQWLLVYTQHEGTQERRHYFPFIQEETQISLGAGLCQQDQKCIPGPFWLPARRIDQGEQCLRLKHTVPVPRFLSRAFQVLQELKCLFSSALSQVSASQHQQFLFAHEREAWMISPIQTGEPALHCDQITVSQRQSGLQCENFAREWPCRVQLRGGYPGEESIQALPGRCGLAVRLLNTSEQQDCPHLVKFQREILADGACLFRLLPGCF